MRSMRKPSKRTSGRFRRAGVCLAALTVCVTGSLTATAVTPATAATTPATQRVIVVLKSTTDALALQAQNRLVSAYRMTQVKRYTKVLQGFSATMVAADQTKLKADSSVSAVYADKRFKVQGEIGTGIKRIQADQEKGTKIGTRKAVNADIAILDTGVDPHPDLNLVGGVNCATNSGCVAGDYYDGYGHGTHVAGIAAAKDNGWGVVGVAPGARIWSVKVFTDDGYGSFSWFIAGLDWIVAKGGIEVANASLSGYGTPYDAVSKAIDRATAVGTVVVVAAGNDESDTATVSPANAPRALAVSAYVDTDGKPGGLGPICEDEKDDTRLSYSNWGSNVTIAAPGGCIRSTYGTNGYETMSGTSMAAPFVAGAAAAVIEAGAIPANADRTATIKSLIRAAYGDNQKTRCGFSGGKSSESTLLFGSCRTNP